MKRQYILLVTVMIALIGASCATTPPYNPFKIDQNKFFATTKTVALVPFTGHADLETSGQVIAKFELLMGNKLREAGFSVLPSKEYRDIWLHNVLQMGTIFDPITGKRDDSKFKTIQEQCYKELAEKLNVDAVLISRILFVKASFYEFVARWDGTEESLDVRSGGMKFLGLLDSSTTTGTVPALSLEVTIKDIHGTPIYLNKGGIQVLTKRSPRFVSVSKNELLVNEERNMTAVDIALDPLIRKSESPVAAIPKTPSDVASETQMAAISAVKINKEEPWTGTWKVKRSEYGDIILNLKQRGNKVKSTRGSTRDFGGKVSGNHLKGWLMEMETHSTVKLKLSQDSMSFKGKGFIWGKTHYLEGERQE